MSPISSILEVGEGNEHWLRLWLVCFVVLESVSFLSDV